MELVVVQRVNIKAARHMTDTWLVIRGLEL